MTREWEEAIGRADVAAVRALLEHGADVDARDRYGQTGLMLAAHGGRLELTRLLIDRGASLDDTAKCDLSALMLAVIGGHVAIVRALVQAGADTELRGSGPPGFRGKTANDMAAAQGRDDLLEALDASAETS